MDVVFWSFLVFFTAVGNSGVRKLLIFLLCFGGILGIGASIAAVQWLDKTMGDVAAVAVLSFLYLAGGGGLIALRFFAPRTA